MKKKIIASSTLKQIIDSRTDAEKILGQHGTPCVTCPMAKLEMDHLKIGEISKIYNLDLKAILKNLNA